MSALSINSMSMEILLQRSLPEGTTRQREIAVASCIAGRAVCLACHLKASELG